MADSIQQPPSQANTEDAISAPLITVAGDDDAKFTHSSLPRLETDQREGSQPAAAASAVTVEIAGHGDYQTAASQPLPPQSVPVQHLEETEPSPPPPVIPPKPEVLEHVYEPHMSDDAIDEVPHEVVTPQPQPVHAEENVEVSPEVATLKAMFPDFDDLVLHSVLESVGGNQDRAIDVLLGMSDPSYVSAHPPQSQPEPVTSLDLDEQLARQLALEDERERQSHRSRRHASGQTWQRRDQPQGRQPGQVPISSPPPQEQEDEPDFTQQAQETLNRFAESSKRTFSSLVSKVKAKINEYDQGSNRQQQPNNQGAPDDNYRVTSAGVRTQSGAPVDRHSASQAVSSQYYGSDPRVQRQTQAQPVGHDWEQVTSGWTGRTSTVVAPPAPQPLRGYDVGDNIPERTPTIRSSQPVQLSTQVTAARTPSPVLPTPAAPSSPPPRGSMSDIPKPPPTNTGTIDAAKIGFLPKRPVSLLGPTPPPTATHPDSDDELEYAENPFEDH